MLQKTNQRKEIPTKVKNRKTERQLLVLDSFSFVPMSLEDIGEMRGIKKYTFKHQKDIQRLENLYPVKNSRTMREREKRHWALVQAFNNQSRIEWVKRCSLDLLITALAIRDVMREHQELGREIPFVSRPSLPLGIVHDSSKEAPRDSEVDRPETLVQTMFDKERKRRSNQQELQERYANPGLGARRQSGRSLRSFSAETRIRGVQGYLFSLSLRDVPFPTSLSPRRFKDQPLA